MKKDLTELVFIIDRSGSMSGLEADTVGGFNSLIEKQRDKDGQCFVSTVFFNDHSQVLHDRVRIDKVRPMKRSDYLPCSCTALIDAVGDAIKHIANIHKYARKSDIPEHTMFVIITDGMENASRKYTGEMLREMITEQKNKYGWEFLFIGANIDAVTTARNYGIESENAVNYHADSCGTQVLYRTVSRAISACRIGGLNEASAWRNEIDEDYENRK